MAWVGRAMLTIHGLFHPNPCNGLRCEKKVGREKPGEKRRVKQVGNNSNPHTQHPFKFTERFQLQQLI